MAASPVRLVVFDLGGVLIRICRSWQEACLRAGVPVRPEWDCEEDRAHRKELTLAYHRGAVSTRDYFSGVAATGGGVYTPEQVRHVHDSWLIGEYEGVGELLDELRTRGVQTGVLSNTNEAHWERLCIPPAGAVKAPEFGVTSKVHHLHASHLLGQSKPDLGCYRAFEARAGVTASGGAVLFFDDLEENIVGAVAAGWTGVMVDHRGDTAAQMRRELVTLGVL